MKTVLESLKGSNKQVANLKE